MTGFGSSWKYGWLNAFSAEIRFAGSYSNKADNKLKPASLFVFFVLNDDWYTCLSEFTCLIHNKKLDVSDIKHWVIRRLTVEKNSSNDNLAIGLL